MIQELDLLQSLLSTSQKKRYIDHELFGFKETDSIEGSFSLDALLINQGRIFACLTKNKELFNLAKDAPSEEILDYIRENNLFSDFSKFLDSDKEWLYKFCVENNIKFSLSEQTLYLYFNNDISLGKFVKIIQYVMMADDNDPKGIPYSIEYYMKFQSLIYSLYQHEYMDEFNYICKVYVAQRKALGLDNALMKFIREHTNW